MKDQETINPAIGRATSELVDKAAMVTAGLVRLSDDDRFMLHQFSFAPSMHRQVLHLRARLAEAGIAVGGGSLTALNELPRMIRKWENGHVSRIAPVSIDQTGLWIARHRVTCAGPSCQSRKHGYCTQEEGDAWLERSDEID